MDKELKQFTRETLLKSMLQSEEWFDKSLTFISGGAMLLSVSFLDKLVPFKEAICIWILIISWLVLITSLVLNLLAHRRSSLNAMITLNELDSDEANVFGKAQTRNSKMNRLTLGSAWSMASGLLLLIIYCSLNLYNMPEDKKVPKGPNEAGKFSVPSYVPSTPANPPAPNNPPSTPPTQAPEKPGNNDSKK